MTASAGSAGDGLPLPFDIPADLDTPVSAFLKLSAFEPCFLLESVEQGAQVGRYSFLGLGRALRVRLDADQMAVAGAGTPLPETRAALLDALRGALAQAPDLGGDPARDLPFRGGLVGATGYGLHHWFQDLGHRGEPRDAPCARYVAPEAVLVFDHMTRRAALLSGDDGQAHASLRREIVRALRQEGVPRAGARPHDPSASASLSPGAFQDAVRRVQHHIREGDVYQAVLSVRFQGDTDLAPFQVYRALRLLNPSPYMYYLDLEGLEIVGSSPEALVQLEDGRARLRPIAGTRRRGVDSEEDDALEEELVRDEKEAAEHVMLVDLARNDLGRVARTGSVEVRPFRTVERYSHVMHLVSGVEGRLEDGVDAFDLFAATFPAGTVSGAPKVRATEIIRALEPVQRGYYSGSVGYFGVGGSMDQAITIRTLIFTEGTWALQAGAGIVADSDPESEYREVVAKGAALRAALDLAAAGLE